MSYDIRVWTTKEYKEDADIPPQSEGNNWLLQVGQSSRVDAEDIPEEVAGSLPGIQYVIDLHLEPMSAPKTAFSLMNKTAKTLAMKYHGVIEDPQTDSITLPSGVKRYAALPKQKGDGKPYPEFRMHWMLPDDSPLIRGDGIDRLIEYFEKNLPEAMPRRYGLAEPLKYKIAENGKEHFIKFFKENKHDSVTWYPSKPLLFISVGVNDHYGFHMSCDSEDFSCHYFSIDIDHSVFSQPGWEAQLKKVWRDVSLILKPFFGAASIGYTWFDPDTGTDYCKPSDIQDLPQHTIGSWWWKGVPKRFLGQAIVVGEPYLSAWPEIKEFGTAEDGLCFVSTEVWKDEKDVADIIKNVPERLARKKSGYPEVFPFDK